MRCIAFLILACLLSIALHTSPSCAEEDDALFYEFTPPGWGFALGLSDAGTVYQPGDPEWAAPDLDWSWISDAEASAEEPIYRIDGQTIPLQDDDGNDLVLTDEGFDAYYGVMAETFSTAPGFDLLDATQGYAADDGRAWHIFNIEEETGGTTQYYYALLGRDDDGELRMISFFYDPAEDDDDAEEAIYDMVLLHLDPGLLEEADGE